MLASDSKKAIDQLISELESAAAGSTALDQRIEYCLGFLGLRANLTELLVSEGVSWPVVSETLGGRVPPYTASLDAAIPGEDILFVLRSVARGKWAAVQRCFGGREVLAWAATEPLARRLAAMKTHAANAHTAGPQLEPHIGPAAAGPPLNETAEWKVRF